MNVLPEAPNDETPATLTLAADVILPDESTVNTGTLDAPPYVLAVTPEALKETLPVAELYVIPPLAAASIDALALDVVKYKLAPSATLPVVSTPELVIPAAN